jgi:uncharacterized protein
VEFEWDEDKAERNFAKHGVRFPFATRLFDEHRVDDPLPYAGEIRRMAIGELDGVILTVIYTARDTEDGQSFIRIISARRASRKERRRYAGG